VTGPVSPHWLGILPLFFELTRNQISFYLSRNLHLMIRSANPLADETLVSRATEMPAARSPRRALKDSPGKLSNSPLQIKRRKHKRKGYFPLLYQLSSYLECSLFSSSPPPDTVRMLSLLPSKFRPMRAGSWFERCAEKLSSGGSSSDSRFQTFLSLPKFNEFGCQAVCGNR
jgi:hypothetical protein